MFTDRGDPRQILSALYTELAGLDNRRRIDRRGSALDARAAAIAVINDQDRAVLAGDVSAFVQAVRDTTRSSRDLHEQNQTD